MKEELQPLDNNTSRIDKLSKIGTAALSSFGPLGAIISKMIDESISSAHQQRIIDFLNELYELYKKQEQEIDNIKKSFEKMLNDNCNTLLFEQSVKAALDTNSNVLHHCYAFYLFNLVNNKQLEDVQHERLLKIISSLSEYELLMLIGYSIPSFVNNISDFHKQYADILFSRVETIKSPEEDIVFNAFREQYIISLEQKGLIERKTEVKGSNLKLSLEKRNPKITRIGKILVNAIYDEDFFKSENKSE